MSTIGISLRPAYVPQFARAERRPLRQLTRVGAESAPVSSDTTKMAKDIGLYVGLPAIGAAAFAHLVGLGAVLTIGAAVLGGSAGYFYMSTSDKKQAEDNAKAAAEAKEKERRAGVDVAAVALQTDAIGMQTKAGLSLFFVGSIPGTTVPGGGTIDYKTASFAAPPTAAMVKQLQDLATTLKAEGYIKAQAQVADAAGAAKATRENQVGSAGVPQVSQASTTSAGFGGFALNQGQAPVGMPHAFAALL